ncbi:hypothetical protein HMPREF3202_00027 [Prevotella bivia]|uniref:Uncharacterized protein n=1 Tax=Prevotella bivia TaxID=28125 RepID=A0A137T1F5_9BACT|nr:hypothetical protein HMPREF3202_00027 [Prevotella bivia]DAL43879.1 MAG TPA_asm: hypothetical protein [Caudoviricetes sp.]DAP39753.1 MAG TPA: hypothetical protein [Caudoviricetes sp.]
MVPFYLFYNSIKSVSNSSNYNFYKDNANEGNTSTLEYCRVQTFLYKDTIYI